MKIRNGFVSNSSTTSFCIYGFMIDPKDNKFMKDEETVLRWIKELWPFPNCNVDDEIEGKTFEQLKDTFNEMVTDGSVIYSTSGPCEWGEVYVGRQMGSGDPMDTSDVIASVRELYQIPEDEKPTWFEDAWRDG